MLGFKRALFSGVFGAIGIFGMSGNIGGAMFSPDVTSIRFFEVHFVCFCSSRGGDLGASRLERIIGFCRRHAFAGASLDRRRWRRRIADSVGAPPFARALFWQLLLADVGSA